MHDFASSPVLVSGAFFASAVETLKEFNQLGQSVLSEHNIESIDKTAFYPNGLRLAIFEAIYERFGDAGLDWIGFESPRQFISVEAYQSSPMAIRLSGLELNLSPNESAGALHTSFLKFLEVYCDELTKILIASTRNADYLIGQFVQPHPSGLPLHYRVKLNAKLPINYAPWTRGTVHYNIRMHLPEGWDFKLSINTEHTKEVVNCSEYFFDLTIFPMAKEHTRFVCSLQDRLASREALLKAALNRAFEQETALKLIHEQTMQSIRYAAAVQKNQLPQVTQKHGFADLAVRWEPKDVIGGDTWWLSPEESPGPTTLAVIDCTGHGVPGAMTAMLVNSTLSRLFSEDPFCSLETALAGVGKSLAQSFGSFDKDSDVSNGCDLVLIQRLPSTSEMKIALAGLDVMHYQRQANKIVWIESPRNGISSDPCADSPHVISQIDYAAGDRLLITSDGLTDQIGGNEKPRSFGYRRTLEFFESTHNQSTAEVVNGLMALMDKWRGTQERRDDVTIVCLDL